MSKLREKILANNRETIFNNPYREIETINVTYDFKVWEAEIENIEKLHPNSFSSSFFDKEGSSRITQYFFGLMTAPTALFDGHSLTAKTKKFLSWKEMIDFLETPSESEKFLYMLTYHPIVPVYIDYTTFNKGLKEPTMSEGGWKLRYADFKYDSALILEG